jgi:hypothetical protein
VARALLVCTAAWVCCLPARARADDSGIGLRLTDAGVDAGIHAGLALERPAEADASGSVDAGPQALDASVDSGSEALDAAAARTPPRALFVPALHWPDGEPAPETGAIEAVVLIEREGQAQLESCEQPASVCESLRSALALARFEPASVNGAPRAARVQVRFALARPSDAAADAGADAAPLVASDAELATEQRSDSSAPRAMLHEEAELYGAMARVEKQKPLATALELEEIRELPGAMGDPFRVIDALPGVVPVMTGLPYVYVRGAPPSATAYFYDDIQLPALFHLALGPAVVHPAMVGGIDFYPGVAPARYGRKTGGVVAGKAMLRELKPGIHGELELRLIDLQAYVATPIRKTGRLEIAGRFGYPGLMAKLFDSHAVIQYWDYQLRSVIPLTRDTEATVIAIGSFDLIGQRRHGQLRRDIELQFHRQEVRLVHRGRGYSLGSALSAGFERSGLGDTLNVQALRLGPKLWLDVGIKRASLRVGADMMGTVGKIYDESSRNEDPSVRGGDEAFSLTDNPIYRSAAARNVIGAYAELNLPIASDWVLEAGLRTDTWITGGDAQAALEPRGLLRYQPKSWLGLHAAFGTAYQPAVFLLPLPGLSDVALDRGLQRAIQAELGARFELPYAFSLETKLFAHFYKNMLALEGLDPTGGECEGSDSQTPASIGEDGAVVPPPDVAPPMCETGRDFGRISARAYGGELLLRRAFSEPVSGWLSYTLSKATAHTDDGETIAPNFDVRHMANLVLQWRISRNWHVSLRGVGMSGRFPLGATFETDPREKARMPPFFRGDLQVSRTWQKRWGELRLTLDWLNFTFQREPLGWDCSRAPAGGKCKIEYVGFPITVPLLGVRATF